MAKAVEFYNKAEDHKPSERMIGGRAVWKLSTQRGRGVYAAEDFAAGEVIECSPVTVIPKAETDLFDEDFTGKESVIDSYLLRWRPEISGQEYCLGHGYLMLYNHNNNPNAALSHDFENRTISMIAQRHIHAGEEITFDYDVELWFQEKSGE